MEIYKTLATDERFLTVSFMFDKRRLKLSIIDAPSEIMLSIHNQRQPQRPFPATSGNGRASLMRYTDSELNICSSFACETT